MTRGLTLIEILLALALLAALASGLAAWVNISASLAAASRDSMAWQQAAEATLSVMADDLRTGDDPQTDPASRIEITERGLRIDTRAAGIGPVTQVYQINTTNQWLTRRRAHDTADRERRRLLSGVADFDAEFIRDDQDEAVIGLRVTITSSANQTISRRFTL